MHGYLKTESARFCLNMRGQLSYIEEDRDGKSDVSGQNHAEAL